MRVSVDIISVGTLSRNRFWKGTGLGRYPYRGSNDPGRETGCRVQHPPNDEVTSNTPVVGLPFGGR